MYYNVGVRGQKNAKVIFKGDEIYDQSRRAERVLDYVLREGPEGEISDTRRTKQVDVNVERKARPVIDIDTGRTASRVLFVTSDQSILSSGSAAQNGYAALSEYFDEVHVLVLVNRKGTNGSVRCADRTWIYSVHNKYWWLLPFSARDAAEEVLVFSGSVRPDIVVGADPYEAGLAAYFIAGAFARPLQIEVREDFTQSAFLRLKPENTWRRRIAKYVLRRTKSVRAETHALKEMLAKQFNGILDLAVLPKYHNFSGYLSAAPSFDIHDRYKDFTFIVLAFGVLSADSNLHTTFAALNRVLHNPHIGLVVIGEGPAKNLFEKKVRILGVERSVVFLSKVDDLISYMKTADLLIETNHEKGSEEHVMRAAAAGLPIVAVETDLRMDLFKDGISAFLCPKDDIECLSQKFSKFLNNPALRKQFARNGIQVAKDRLIEDPDSFYRAYRDSIEVILETQVPAESEEQNDIDAQSPTDETRKISEDGMSYPTMESVPGGAKF